MNERRLTRRAALGALAAPWLAPRPAAPASPPPKAGFLRHYYWTNGASSAALLARQAGRIDLVSPQWFHVQAGGRVRAEIDLELVAMSGELRVPLAPVVVNENFRPEIAAELMGRQELWGALCEELGTTAVAYGFRGLQVDFEGLPPNARVNYARFVAKFSRALHARGLECTIAVGAPLAAVPEAGGEWSDGPHAEALDYEALGRAVDAMTVMTYDQHTEPGDPGPVAGRPWVEACARRLLEVVPARKLLLGVPLYYRRWSGPVVQEGSHAEAMGLASRFRSAVQLDPREGEKTYRFVENGVTNVVWLQDRETLRERVALARRLGLRGFSAWRLGHEDRSIWTETAPVAQTDHGTKTTSHR